jgi:hypothetical protein
MAEKRKRGLVLAPEYLVEIMGRRYPVQGMVEASRLVEAVRDRSGAGASEMGAEFPVYEGGRMIGYVSYNGRVWKGLPGAWPDVELMYDPAAERSEGKLAGHVAEDNAPGLARAVDAVLRSAARDGLDSISVERAFRAVLDQTSILDDARLYLGDKALIRVFAEALDAAGASQGVGVTA